MVGMAMKNNVETFYPPFIGPFGILTLSLSRREICQLTTIINSRDSFKMAIPSNIIFSSFYVPIFLLGPIHLQQGKINLPS